MNYYDTYGKDKLEDYEKIKEYFVKLKQGQKEYKTIICEKYIRLVIYCVRKFNYIKDYHQIEQELINIGVIGLLKAIDSFNIDKKIKFISYATVCINNEILMYFRMQKKHYKNQVSLYETCHDSNEGKDVEYFDVLEDTKINLEDDYLRKEEYYYLYKLLNDLDDESREIICSAYGIGVDKCSQHKLAEKYHISQSYMSRIVRKIIKQMQTNYEKNEKEYCLSKKH